MPQKDRITLSEIATMNPPAHYTMTALLLGLTVTSAIMGVWDVASFSGLMTAMSAASSYNVWKKANALEA